MATTYTPLRHAAMVSFVTLSDGSVYIVATGRHGSLTLHVAGGEDGPRIDIPDPDRVPTQYKGVWGLEANGRLSGWIVDDNGKIKWFPVRVKQKARKRSAKARQATKTIRKEG